MNKVEGKCVACPVFNRESSDGYYLGACPVLLRVGDENPSVDSSTSACGYGEEIAEYLNGTVGVGKVKEMRVLSGFSIRW